MVGVGGGGGGRGRGGGGELTNINIRDLPKKKFSIETYPNG